MSWSRTSNLGSGSALLALWFSAVPYWVSMIDNRPPDQGNDSAKILTIDEICIRHMRSVLDKFGGNKVHTARALGVSVRTVYRWLEREDA